MDRLNRMLAQAGGMGGLGAAPGAVSGYNLLAEARSSDKLTCNDYIG